MNSKINHNYIKKERKKIFFSLVKFFAKWYIDIDRKTLLIVLLITVIGSILMASASPSVSNRIHVIHYHFLIRHILYTLLGIFLMFFISLLSDDAILYFAKHLFIFAIFLLIVLLFIGYNIKGSSRWLDLGFFSIQPSEFMKPLFIIVLAHEISMSVGKTLKILKSLTMIFILVGLIVSQPDFGTSILYIIIWAIQMFISDISYKIFYLILPLLFIIILLGFTVFPHFRYRIDKFISSSNDMQYQVKKSLETIQHGGLSGQGLGNGTLKNQVPDVHSDYIFSVFVEEFGILLSLGFILLFIILISRILLRNLNIKDHFKQNVIFGCVSLLAIENFVNIAVTLNLLPSKGMAMPFFSYGGSSTISTFIIIGIILAFTRKSYSFKSPYEIFSSNNC